MSTRDYMYLLDIFVGFLAFIILLSGVFMYVVHLSSTCYRCKGLMILETYTTDSSSIVLPDFLTIECDVTDQPLYSMYNLSKKEYHITEVKAGVTRSADAFNYRRVYAEEATNGKDEYIVKNGLH